MKTTLIVSSGQYETQATTVTVNHKTWSGLCRRITQIRNDYATFGDNFAGWLPAQIALASDNDEWGDNSIIGGQWCNPVNGWLSKDPDDNYDGPTMLYSELFDKLYGKR